MGASVKAYTRASSQCLRIASAAESPQDGRLSIKRSFYDSCAQVWVLSKIRIGAVRFQQNHK